MHNNNYKLRSKEVQEVLNTPPRIYILWGNTMVVLLLVFFLIGLNTIKMSVTVRLPIKIKSWNNVSQVTEQLDLQASGTSVYNYNTSQKAKLSLDRYTGTGNNQIDCQLVAMDHKTNVIDLYVNKTDWNKIEPSKDERIPADKNLAGTLEVSTGSISMLKLFFNKVTKR